MTKPIVNLRMLDVYVENYDFGRWKGLSFWVKIAFTDKDQISPKVTDIGPQISDGDTHWDGNDDDFWSLKEDIDVDKLLSGAHTDIEDYLKNLL